MPFGVDGSVYHTMQRTCTWMIMQVGLVGVDIRPVIPRAAIFQTASTIPICSEAILELESFMTSFTPTAVNYGDAFDKAFSLFSDSSATGTLVHACTHNITYMYILRMQVNFIRLRKLSA